MKTIYLLAGALSGIQEIDPIDYPSMDVEPADSFLEQLPYLELYEQIFTAVTEGDSDYEAIKTQYGIQS